MVDMDDIEIMDDMMIIETMGITEIMVTIEDMMIMDDMMIMERKARKMITEIIMMTTITNILKKTFILEIKVFFINPPSH